MSKLQNRGNVTVIGGLGGGGAGSGNVTGPVSATNDALSRYNGATGELIKDSPNAILADDGTLTLAGQISSRLGGAEIEIFSASDLPAPSGGTITLPTGTYIFKQSITLSDTLTIAPGATVELLSPGFGPTVTYTGTGTFINSVSGAFVLITRVNIVLTGASATLFGLTSNSLIIDTAFFLFAGTGQSVGTVDPQTIGMSFQNTVFTGFTVGLTLNGSTILAALNSNMLADSGASGSVLTLASGLTEIDVNNVTFTAGTGAVFDIDSGFVGVANILSVVVAVGDFFSGSSLDETDSHVNVQSSPPQKPSFNIGSVVAASNAVATVISTINTFVDLNLNASAALGSNAELWSLSGAATGELTYDGMSPFFGTLSAAITCTSSASAQDYTFRLVKNGSPLSDGVLASIELDSGLRNIALIVPVTAVEGDDFRLQVENNSGTDNLTIVHLSLQVS